MSDPVKKEDILDLIEDSREVWEPKAEERGLPLPHLDQELGCGYHGCVFPTDDPKVVVKCSIDQTEIAFWRFQNEYGLPGFAKAYAGIGVYGGFLLWRENVDLCCDEAIKSLQRDLGLPEERWTSTPWYYALVQYEDALYFDRSPAKAFERLALIPGTQYLAVGLKQAFVLGMTFTDFYETNMGRNLDSEQLLIFDIQSKLRKTEREER